MRAIVRQDAVRTSRIVGIRPVVLAADGAAAVAEGVGQEVLHAPRRLPAQRHLQRVVVRRAAEIVQRNPVQRVERPEQREVVADARHSHAVDRHRQVDAVERAPAQHAERHDIAVRPADEVAPSRADVAHLDHLVQRKAARVRQAEAVRLRPAE